MNKKLIRFDWAIKRLLRNKANFQILEGFLSELIADNIKIKQVLESESNQKHQRDKFNRVDLLVENELNELILVEIQNENQVDYFQRMLYGVSKLVSEHINQGTAYKDVRKVIAVNIVYFDIGQGKDYIYHGFQNFIGVNLSDHLELSEAQKDFFGDKKLFKLFPEYYIIKVNNFDEVAKNSLDEWIYFLKNEEIKPEFNAKGLSLAKNELDILKLSPDERKEYENYLEDLSYQSSMYFSTFQSGERENAFKIAKKALDMGFTDEQILILTELNQKQLDWIKQNKL
jgi:predicted transposase/invertase (TIGR01784 family)